MASETRSPSEHAMAAEILAGPMNDVALAIDRHGPMLMSATASGGYIVVCGPVTTAANTLAQGLTATMAAIQKVDADAASLELGATS